MRPTTFFMLFIELIPFLGLIFTFIIYSKSRKKHIIINSFFPINFYSTINKNLINLVYCSTSNHLENVAISTISILNQTKSKLRVYIFTNQHFNKTHTIFDQIEKETAYQVQFTFDFISLDYVKKVFNYRRGDWNPYTLARLLIVDKLPVSKCIYLDTDVFGCGDIKELWDIDLGNNLMAGATDALPFKRFVRDDHIDFLNSYIGDEERLKMKMNNVTGFSHKNYLNGGVLSMNVDELKKMNFVNKSLSLWNKRHLLFLDQDIINLVIGHRRVVVDLKFNKCWYGKFTGCVLRHYNHKKVNKGTNRHIEDFDYYFDAFDEYTRLKEKMNQTMN